MIITFAWLLWLYFGLLLSLIKWKALIIFGLDQNICDRMANNAFSYLADSFLTKFVLADRELFFLHDLHRTSHLKKILSSQSKWIRSKKSITSKVILIENFWPTMICSIQIMSTCWPKWIWLKTNQSLLRYFDQKVLTKCESEICSIQIMCTVGLDWVSSHFKYRQSFWPIE